MTSLRFVEKLRDLVDGKEVVLSDIWGVVHNGLESFPEACDALHTYRKQGGTVILITNAPRPADSVQRQLRKLGVADETYDAIVSSGDLTRLFVADHPGKKMFWLGPERDSSIHRGLDAVIAPLEQADYIVCTGLFDDETESAEDYRAMMLAARDRQCRTGTPRRRAGLTGRPCHDIAFCREAARRRRWRGSGAERHLGRGP